MRIGIEYIAALGSGGISTYAKRLLAVLFQEGADHKFFLYTLLHHQIAFYSRFAPPARNAVFRGAYIPSLPIRGFSMLANHVSPILLRVRTRKDRVNVFHFLNPLTYAELDSPVVTTIHDLAALRHHDWTKASTQEVFRKALPGIIRGSARIITVSESTRKDLLALFPEAAQKTRVIYHGRDPKFRRTENPETRIQALYGLSKPFVLYVGEIQPRKNVHGIIDAFAILPKHLRSRYDLVIAGRARNPEAIVSLQLRAGSLGIATSVRFLAYVPFEILPDLYSAARVFVYPSFYEGFGLPLLEALQCGAPAITSHTSSLPEVGGNAALYVSPESPEELAEKLAQLLEDAVLREKLRRAGLAQAEKFSWQKAAQETLAVYQEVSGLAR